MKEVAALKRLRTGAPKTAYDVMLFIYLFWVASENFDRFQTRTLGNIDRLLTPYYRADLAAGRTTETEFREQFRHFWWQWGSINNYWGQPVYLGGTKADGTTEYNEVSEIILDIHDELCLPTPKMHLKMGRSTPDWVWKKTLDMARRTRSVAFFGEAPAARQMIAMGHTVEEARECVIWGCNEWGVRDSANKSGAAYVNAVKAFEDVFADARAGKWTPADFAAFRDGCVAKVVALFETARDLATANESNLHLVNPSNVFSLSCAWSVEKGVDAYGGGTDAAGRRIGGTGAMYQRGGSFRGPLHLGAQPGNVAYVKESGFFDNAEAELKIGGNAFASVHLLAGDNAVTGALKLDSSNSDYSTNGGSVYYQAGGSNTVYHICQAASKEGCESVLALEGKATVLRCTGWCQSMIQVDPTLSFTAFSAINDGARLASGRFARGESFAKTEGGLAKWYLSIDGGILHLLYAGDWFVDTSGGRGPDKVIVQQGGVSIDTSCSSETTLSVPFEAPVGKIVESIDLPTDEAFANEVYLTPVKVSIQGVGEGAAAIAILDKERRTIKEIKVVARGTGYDDTTTATIEAAKHTYVSAKQVRYICKVNLVDAPTSGAGLCKLGSGTFDLQTVNTFRGPVTVQKGAVRFRVAGSLPSGASLVVGDGATANFSGGYGSSSEPVSVPTLEVAGAALVTGLPKSGLRVTGTLKVDVVSGKKASVEGPLVLADGVTISGVDVSKLDAERKNIILEADATGGITCEGSVTLPDVPQGWRVYLSGRRLCVSRERGALMIIR